MSTTIDEAMLGNFVAWREARAGESIDLSPRAYLDELENDANRVRIQEAVNLLAPMKDVYPSEYGGQEATNVIKEMRDVALRAFDVLVGDRQIMIDSKLTGEVTVVFT